MSTRTLPKTRAGIVSVLVLLSGATASAESADPIVPPGNGATGEVPPPGSSSAVPTDWRTRQELSGDWGGTRSWLEERGITVRPRLAQFYQGVTAGEGEHGFVYGGKADLLVSADLGELGLWKGLSMTVQADLNFGKSVNGRAGVLVPPNTALLTPGLDGADAFDVSSLYFGQTFGSRAAVLFGKLNMIEVVASKLFMGGAGIDAFWNHTFTATPTGTVPPYLLGALGAVFTERATYRLWVFDPNSFVNRAVVDDPFEDGVSVRASADFNISIGGRSGHQGVSAYYSTMDGTDLSTLGDILLPTPDPGAVTIKDHRYYFAYGFDQYLYQSATDPSESYGLFGNVGISDGNPNGLRWSMYLGIGGTGVIRSGSRDRWGAGYYYDGISTYVKDALPISDEQGLEVFYDFALTPWFSLGVDLQVIAPGLGSTTAVIPGVRAVLRV